MRDAKRVEICRATAEAEDSKWLWANFTDKAAANPKLFCWTLFSSKGVNQVFLSWSIDQYSLWEAIWIVICHIWIFLSLLSTMSVWTSVNWCELIAISMNDLCRLRKGPKKTFFFGKVFPNVWTHPRAFLSIVNTKGEIRVKKGDFQGDFFLGGGWPGLAISHPTDPYLGKHSQKKRFFFGTFP